MSRDVVPQRLVTMSLGEAGQNLEGKLNQTGPTRQTRVVYSAVRGAFPAKSFRPTRWLSFLSSHREEGLALAWRDGPEGGTAPGFIPGIDWSDHWSFEQVGIPALMITDTALFRYPHYHTAADSPDKVDYERLARVASGLERVIRSWAKIPDTRPEGGTS